MQDLVAFIQQNSFFISYAITIIIAVFSLYESYRNKRKFDQLNKESLVSKVSVDFDYKTEKTDNFKIVKGKMTFTNRGTTNIKLIKLNFDVMRRSTLKNILKQQKNVSILRNIPILHDQL